MEKMNKETFLGMAKHFVDAGNHEQYEAAKKWQIEGMKSFDAEFGRLYEQLVENERAIIRYAKSRLEK